MNTRITDYLTSKGMTISGNYAYGNLDGFETNVIQDIGNKMVPLYVYISCFLDKDQKITLQSEVHNGYNDQVKIWIEAYGLKLGFNSSAVGFIQSKVPQYLDQFIAVMKNVGVKGIEYCPTCGKEKSEGGVSVRNIGGGVSVVMHDECAEQINAVIEREDREFENAPNNYKQGFIGALIGGLAGAVVTVIFALMGYISAWSAIIAVLLGSFLYKKCGGKPKKMMVLIVAVTSLVCILLTSFFIYVYNANVIAANSGVNVGAFEAFGICMGISEFAAAFWADFALTFLFTLIGLAFVVGSLLRSVKRAKKI